MFEELTAILPMLQQSEFGKVIYDTKNDGTYEHPKHWPYIVYNNAVEELIKATYSFVDEHIEMDLTNYEDILKDAGIQYSARSLRNIDVSNHNGNTVMAMIVGILRADRFVDGTLLEFCNNGCIEKWLLRLKQIDEESEVNESC